MTLAEFVLSQKKQYNGHLTLEINHMSVRDGLQLCKDLEIFVEHSHMFTMELYTDGGFNINQKDFWRAGEHPLGHTDRLILGVENR